MVRTTSLTQALIGKITVKTIERAATGGLRYGIPNEDSGLDVG